MQKSTVSPIRWLFVLLATAALLVPSLTLARSAKPFKATIAISEVVPFDSSGPCPLMGNITGSGNASHMGKVTLTSQDCIIPIVFPTSFYFTSNLLILTAANGDRIYATYNGNFTIEGQIGAISGFYSIHGGTGRFLNARGVGEVQGLENVSFQQDAIHGQGQVQLTGTIVY